MLEKKILFFYPFPISVVEAFPNCWNKIWLGPWPRLTIETRFIYFFSPVVLLLRRLHFFSDLESIQTGIMMTLMYVISIKAISDRKRN